MAALAGLQHARHKGMAAVDRAPEVHAHAPVSGAPSAFRRHDVHGGVVSGVVTHLVRLDPCLDGEVVGEELAVDGDLARRARGGRRGIP